MLYGVLVVSCICLSFSCLSFSVAQAKEAASAEALTGIPYTIKPSINKGDAITLELWQWAGPRAEYQREWAQAYNALYPNVSINVILQPWKHYFTALKTSLLAGQGPDLFHMHNRAIDDFCAQSLMAPLNENVVNIAYLKQAWMGFASNQHSCPDGLNGYLPMGAMMPVVYVNTELWQAAGLTEADYPKTWAELIDRGLQLTQRDQNGRIVVAGFTFHPAMWLENMVYKQGRYLLDSTNQTIQTENPEFQTALSLAHDLAYKHQVTDMETNSQGLDGFLVGRSAMYLAQSWVAATLKTRAERLQWDAFKLPDITRSGDPVYGVVKYPIDVAVNPNLDDDRAAVVWDFWHYAYSQSNNVLEDMALFNGFIPPVRALLSAPQVLDNKLVRMTSEQIDRAMAVELPAPLLRAQSKLMETILLTPSPDWKALLAEAAKTQNAALDQVPVKWTENRVGPHHPRMLAD